MENITHVNPNDYIEVTDVKELIKGDYIFDEMGEYKFLILDVSNPSTILCRNMETGTKSNVNRNGLQAQILNHGWKCRRYGIGATSGYAFSPVIEQEIQEVLRIAGVNIK